MGPLRRSCSNWLCALAGRSFAPVPSFISLLSGHGVKGYTFWTHFCMPSASVPSPQHGAKLLWPKTVGQNQFFLLTRLSDLRCYCSNEKTIKTQTYMEKLREI